MHDSVKIIEEFQFFRVTCSPDKLNWFEGELILFVRRCLSDLLLYLKCGL